MNINLVDAGKRFNRDWIFRHLNFDFSGTGSYAITGPNGSGKSTLLQVIAGSMQQSEGTIQYHSSNSTTRITEPYLYVAIAAPYLELIEEFTANEFLAFHQGFKALTTSIPEVLASVNLGNAAAKQIRYYSSGMKQRLKLAQAFFSDAPILLLDEPTSNLDHEGVEIYQQLISGQSGKRLIIVSSNVEEEYAFCQEIIRIQDYR